MVTGAHLPEGRRARGAGKLRAALRSCHLGSFSDMPRSVNLKERNNSEECVNDPQMSQQSNSSDDSCVLYQAGSTDAF